eukprot:TRINITY_DN6612_c0_g2_i2.p1 TRINITY_DN6612_c0_g2~~TRINITY_DN6612_c0_g2_i2.p1  ORF type:complete len:312 (+),score=11.93 TRINITY_DN6612_c0_g2_i2:98-1033(+)
MEKHFCTDKRSIRYQIEQQVVPGISFLPQPKHIMICSTISFICLITIGFSILGVSASLEEIWIDYKGANTTFTLNSDINDQVYLYFSFSNYYQNHRVYIQSQAYKQLSGNDLEYGDVNKYCQSVTLNSALYPDQIRPGIKLDSVAFPCGWMAKSYSAETFTILDSAGNRIPIDEKSIAWSVDTSQKFKNLADISKQWIDVTNEHFVNWMCFSSTSKWKKLYGKISPPLRKGTYTLFVNNVYDRDLIVSNGTVTKSIIIATIAGIGGRSMFIGTLITICGFAFLIMAVVVYWLAFKRQQNSIKYATLDFDWK